MTVGASNANAVTGVTLPVTVPQGPLGRDVPVAQRAWRVQASALVDGDPEAPVAPMIDADHRRTGQQRERERNRPGLDPATALAVAPVHAQPADADVGQ